MFDEEWLEGGEAEEPFFAPLESCWKCVGAPACAVRGEDDQSQSVVGEGESKGKDPGLSSTGEMIIDSSIIRESLDEVVKSGRPPYWGRS